MSRKKRDYGVMVRERQKKKILVHGCSHPQVIDGSMNCDGDCGHCEYQTVEEITINT